MLGHLSLGTGALTFASNNTTLQVLADNLSINNALDLDFNAIVDSQSFTMNLTGPISGPGSFTKIGAGSLIVSNSVNNYTGNTLINAGTLVVNGLLSSSAVTVSANGTLSGNGAVQDVSVNGILAPGYQTETLTVNGQYTQSSSGTLKINYMSPTDFSKVNILGAPVATIAGKLVIDAPQTALPPPAEGIIIFQTANGFTGTFGQVSTSPMFRPQVFYNADSISVGLTPVLGPKQINTINNTQRLPAIGTNQIYSFLRNQTARMHRQIRNIQTSNAPKNMVGEYTQPEKIPSLEENRAFESNNASPLLATANDLSLDHEKELFPNLEEHRTLLADDATDASTQQQQLKRAIAEQEAPYAPRGRFYISPTGNIGKISGVDYWAAGGQARVEYAFSQVGLGSILNYTHNTGSGYAIDSASINLYSTYVPKQMAALAFNAIVNYGRQWLSFHTQKGFPGNLETAKGKPTGEQLSALFGIEYTFDKNLISSMPTGLQFSPMATLQYLNQSAKGYKEHGAGEFDLEFKGLDIDSLVMTLELISFYTKTWNNFSFSSQITMGWQREFFDLAAKCRFRPIDFEGPFMSVELTPPGINSAIAGADFLFSFYQKYRIEANWNFTWNELYWDNQFYLGFNYLF
jgi:autotransporter-associated beta strand protein